MEMVVVAWQGEWQRVVKRVFIDVELSMSHDRMPLVHFNVLYNGTLRSQKPLLLPSIIHLT
jgi:hypothetical protein